MSDCHKKILSISQKFSPETNPTAIRSSKTLKYLPDAWQVHVLSGNQHAALEGAQVHFVRSWLPEKLLNFIRFIKLGKLLDWFVWPDKDIFWLMPAVFKGVKIIKAYNIDLIVVFLKPYSAGIIGILLKWLTGKPLVINVCEPSTCDDLYAVFPTKLHYYLNRWLEDMYVRLSDAIIYVSQLSLEQVRSRQAQEQYSKFHLIRGGADPQDFQGIIGGSAVSDGFEIVFTGGMTGWEEFLPSSKQNFIKRLRHAWMNWGRYVKVNVNPASSSPIFIGRAIKRVIAQNPSWRGKIKLTLYGNRFEPALAVLENQDLSDVVSVTGPIPYKDALQKLQRANLLFMPLPDRMDGTPGERISLKTYEYLMTDRPILAAVPPGENRNYLSDKPGVYLVNPFDVEAMAQVIEQLAIKHMAGETLIVDRVETQRKISYYRRGDELATLVLDVLDRADNGKSCSGALVMESTTISSQR
ncbi:MAG: glycosyltransferase [Cyanobacteria bacterium J06554_1]